MHIGRIVCNLERSEAEGVSPSGPRHQQRPDQGTNSAPSALSTLWAQPEDLGAGESLRG